MTSLDTGPGPTREVVARLHDRGAVEYEGHPRWWKWNGNYYPYPEVIDVVLAAPQPSLPTASLWNTVLRVWKGRIRR